MTLGEEKYLITWKKQTCIFLISFTNTFVWLSVRNLAFLPLGKGLGEAGRSTWIVAGPSFFIVPLFLPTNPNFASLSVFSATEGLFTTYVSLVSSFLPFSRAAEKFLNSLAGYSFYGSNILLPHLRGQKDYLQEIFSSPCFYIKEASKNG